MPEGSFTADNAAIRAKAMQKMGGGPVTGSYGKDPGHAGDLVDLSGS
jgi:hypothetical protein